MPHYVYILYSNSTDSFYKGATEHLDERLARHNAGTEKFTAPGRPWIRLWSITKESRIDALALEKKLKNLSRERTIRFMLKYQEGIEGPDALLLLKQWSGC